jgi:maltose alpha-D-glucosyltransferase / alpha-amylase
MTKWFKNAIIYSLDVETFCDLNADGVGDFKGLISKLDYLSGLGITCLWLLPFFPSPNRDNGYDVKDYYNVDDRLGDLGDFVQFIKRCRELGIKVIIDLVINHTSIEHSWFKQARKDEASPFREFYIWSDKPLPFHKKDLTFHGEEPTMWTYDKQAGQYYLHRFYKEQPDLNISSPALRQELFKVMEFWLCLGVDGFRIDAAEMLIENYGMNNVKNKELELFLDQIREFLMSKNPDAILLAEANIPPKRVSTYFQDNKRMHMIFNFYMNQHLFLSFVKQDYRDLVKAFKKLPKPTLGQQWLNFLRQHDELTLALLNDTQAKTVLDIFAPDEEMRIYNKGVRRRLAPMVNNDQRKLQFLYSLLFSLPGAVLIRYGDEIGMGDDLSLEGRTSVRTPMQWSSRVHGGFSNAPSRKLVHPVIREGEFAYEQVNVLAQQRNPDSLLNFIERLITTRKQIPEIGEGNYKFFEPDQKEIIIHQCEQGNVRMLFLHNLSDQALKVPLKKLIRENEVVFEIFCDPGSRTEEKHFSLNTYGFMWLRCEKKD